jgi:hypothetical protein
MIGMETMLSAGCTTQPEPRPPGYLYYDANIPMQ